MAKNGKMPRKANARTLVIDASYLRDEAKLAVRTYFAPLTGIFSSSAGRSASQGGDHKKRA